MNQEYDYLVKILIVGESGVGKTCLLQRFEQGNFSVSHLPTIAIDFKMKLAIYGDKRLKMQIWDTAGQERFNTLTAGFFKCIVISLPRHHLVLLDYRPKVLRVHSEVDGPDCQPRAQKREGHSRRQQERHGAAEGGQHAGRLAYKARALQTSSSCPFSRPAPSTAIMWRFCSSTSARPSWKTLTTAHNLASTTKVAL